MKTIVKQKTDLNVTGNKQVKLNNWENKLFEVMSGKLNPSVTKMDCSVSAGLKRIFDDNNDADVLKKSSIVFTDLPSEKSAKKRVSLRRESAKTVNLSNAELQRLVLLEQLLGYTREKRLHFQEKSAQARITNIHCQPNV